jgi:hypothetical protein
MTLLKTTALGLILLLGLTTHSHAATAAEGMEDGEQSAPFSVAASRRLLTQQQIRHLKEAGASIHALSPLDETMSFFHYLGRQQFLSDETLRNVNLFSQVQRSFNTDTEAKWKVSSALKSLDLTVGNEEGDQVTSEQFGGLVSAMASHSASPLADQTMHFMKLLQAQSFMTETLADFFTKVLRVEIALDDKSNPDRYTKALGVFDLGVEEPMKSLSAKEFEALKLTVSTTHSRQLSLPEKTANLLGLLKRKRIIDASTHENFDKLLQAQRTLTQNPEDLLGILGIQKGASSGVGTLTETDIKELIHTLDTVPSSLLEKTDFVLTFLADKGAIDSQQREVFGKFVAAQRALSRSMGDNGLRSAFSALGIVIEPALQRPSSATPKKASAMTVSQKLGLPSTPRAESQAPLGFSSSSARMAGQSPQRPSSAASPRKPVERKKYVSDELRQEIEAEAERMRLAREAEVAAEKERLARQRAESVREDGEESGSSSAPTRAGEDSSVAGGQDQAAKGPSSHPTDTSHYNEENRVSEE